MASELDHDELVDALGTAEARIRELELQLQEARPPRCLWHENCDLPAGHEKCGECGKGKGGACSACHCDHTLQVDLRIAERQLQACRNRIEDDSNTSDNLCKSIGITESVNGKLSAELTAANLRIRELEQERDRLQESVNAGIISRRELIAENDALRAQLQAVTRQLILANESVERLEGKILDKGKALQSVTQERDTLKAVVQLTAVENLGDTEMRRAIGQMAKHALGGSK